MFLVTLAPRSVSAVAAAVVEAGPELLSIAFMIEAQAVKGPAGIALAEAAVVDSRGPATVVLVLVGGARLARLADIIVGIGR